MNRLWVRITLTIVGIIVFVVFAQLIQIGQQTFDFDDNRQFDGHEFFERFIIEESEPDEDDEDELSDGEDDLFTPVPGILIVESIWRILFGVTIAAIFAGIMISLGMTRPLNDIAQGAKALAAHNLSQRIPVRGSLEMQTVAHAFNDMAAELEEAETIRKNMLADIAHELRTPLTVLQGNLRAMLDDVYELDKAEVARLYEQTRHLTRLVNELRELTQAEAGQLTLNISNVDIAKLAQNTYDDFSVLAKESKIKLEIEITSDIPEVQVDPARITQCLHNLLDNAFRHTSENGTVVLNIYTNNNTIHIEVHNDGATIPSEQLPRIFDRYYRLENSTSASSHSSGLGLSIVKAIIELHGGRVLAKNKDNGTGNVFGINLPIT